MRRSRLVILREECLISLHNVKLGLLTLEEYKEIEQLYFDALILYVECGL